MSAPAQHVLVRIDGAVGRITLNRPEALHALTEAMCATMSDALTRWRDDVTVEAVMIDHAGERGFCAGGDIRMLAESGSGDGAAARSFFLAEYRLNHQLFTYSKPVVAVMDGVVMGGGVGISLPCRFRIATERTIFAMPETGIGLFPDVGGGWYLPRLPYRAGYWLGLTGARIKAADCLLLGLATHCVESSRLAALKSAVCADPASLDEILRDAAAPPAPAPLEPHLNVLQAAFSAPTVAAVIERLTLGGEWAQLQAGVLAGKSPQAMKVTWAQLARGERLTSFADNMAMEYRLATRVVHQHDFLEGVRAVIVSKDNDPHWRPTSLAQTPDDVIEQLFAPLPDGQAWTPLNPGTTT